MEPRLPIEAATLDGGTTEAPPVRRYNMAGWTGRKPKEAPGGPWRARQRPKGRCCISFVSFIFHLSPGLGRFWKKQVGEKEGATGGLYCTGYISYIILDVHNVCTMVLKVLKGFLVLRILDAGLLRFTVRQRNYTFQVPR